MEGQSDCQPCPAGYACEGTGTILPAYCPRGKYCKLYDSTDADIIANGDSNIFNCPAGYYNPFPYQQSVDQCVPCQPGYYCIEGAVTPTGVCDSGYICAAGEGAPNPDSDFDPDLESYL